MKVQAFFLILHTCLVYWLLLPGCTSDQGDHCDDNPQLNCSFSSHFCGWSKENFDKGFEGGNHPFYFAQFTTAHATGKLESDILCSQKEKQHCLVLHYRIAGRSGSDQLSASVQVQCPDATFKEIWETSAKTDWKIAELPIVSAQNFSIIVATETTLGGTSFRTKFDIRTVTFLKLNCPNVGTPVDPVCKPQPTTTLQSTESVTPTASAGTPILSTAETPTADGTATISSVSSTSTPEGTSTTAETTSAPVSSSTSTPESLTTSSSLASDSTTDFESTTTLPTSTPAAGHSTSGSGQSGAIGAGVGVALIVVLAATALVFVWRRRLLCWKKGKHDDSSQIMNAHTEDHALSSLHHVYENGAPVYANEEQGLSVNKSENAYESVDIETEARYSEHPSANPTRIKKVTTVSRALGTHCHEQKQTRSKIESKSSEAEEHSSDMKSKKSPLFPPDRKGPAGDEYAVVHHNRPPMSKKPQIAVKLLHSGETTPVHAGIQKPSDTTVSGYGQTKPQVNDDHHKVGKPGKVETEHEKSPDIQHRPFIIDKEQDANPYSSSARESANDTYYSVARPFEQPSTVGNARGIGDDEYNALNFSGHDAATARGDEEEGVGQVYSHLQADGEDMYSHTDRDVRKTAVIDEDYSHIGNTTSM